MSGYLSLAGIGAVGGSLAVLIFGALIFFQIGQALYGSLLAGGAVIYVIAGAAALILRAAR